MLPAESLNDVFAYFKYFDLGFLLLTNKKFSSIAGSIYGSIRVSELSQCDVEISPKNRIYVENHNLYGKLIHKMRFADRTAMLEFVNEAFPHCVLGGMCFTSCNSSILRDIKEAVKTVIVTGVVEFVIHHTTDSNVTEPELIDFVGAFQRVPRITILDYWETDYPELVAFCQRKNIELMA
ncbi:hypothetical protein AAVH_33424, partial [Aphelenchoides avenae]